MSGSLEDPQKAVNVSLWETRDDMDDYYANNKDYLSFLQLLKPNNRTRNRKQRL